MRFGNTTAGGRTWVCLCEGLSVVTVPGLLLQGCLEEGLYLYPRHPSYRVQNGAACCVTSVYVSVIVYGAWGDVHARIPYFTKAAATCSCTCCTCRCVFLLYRLPLLLSRLVFSCLPQGPSLREDMY